MITPGQWAVRFFSDEEDSDFFVQAPNNNMPELGYGIEIMQDDYGDHNGYPRSQRLADARAISAVPDMIEAIQWAILFVSTVHPEPNLLAKCKSALKKAGVDV